MRFSAVLILAVSLVKKCSLDRGSDVEEGRSALFNLLVANMNNWGKINANVTQGDTEATGATRK